MTNEKALKDFEPGVVDVLRFLGGLVVGDDGFAGFEVDVGDGCKLSLALGEG